ncbi:conserved hypothetical protein [delta proteobacterium NaphS2]|nr:conserved hypothetical protein [delta proteobacterium NaphS2]
MDGMPLNQWLGTNPAPEKLTEMAQWLGRLYEDEYFDFKKNPRFIATGKKLMSQAFDFRKHAYLNTNFVFLHRTRYGLLRLFEQMGVRVCFRNPFEYY